MFTQTHRFWSRVAVYVGDGSTVYLTPKEARKLARALNACARDIAKFPNFGRESKFETVEFELSDPKFQTER